MFSRLGLVRPGGWRLAWISWRGCGTGRRGFQGLGWWAAGTMLRARAACYQMAAHERRHAKADDDGGISSPGGELRFEDGLSDRNDRGSFGHDQVTFNLRKSIDAKLAGRPCRTFGPNVKIIADGRVRYPDAGIVRASGCL